MKILAIIISTVLIQFAYGLTQAEREAVVQAHNNYRSQLAKGQTILLNSHNAQPAKNLYKLTYNTSIESVAQAWADRCAVEHSNGSGLGENLYYIGDGDISFADALTNASAYWWGEFNVTGGLFYQYGFAYWNQSELEEIGDAIQMAWANTTQIGCGVQYCSSYTFVVCNYYQQGNSMCSPVYEVGQACAADNQCTSFPNSTCEVSSGLCHVEETWNYLNDPSNAMTSTSCKITPPQCASCVANLPMLINGSVSPYIYIDPIFLPQAGNPGAGNCRVGIMCNGTNISLMVNGTVNGNTNKYGYHNNGTSVSIELDCWNYTTAWYFIMNPSVSVHDVSCQVTAADFAPQTQLKIDTLRSLRNDAALVQVASTEKEHGYKKVTNTKKSAAGATDLSLILSKNKRVIQQNAL